VQGTMLQCRMTLIEVSSGLHETDERSGVLAAPRGLALCQSGTTIYTTSYELRVCIYFLILSFRRVLYVICFLLGNSLASEF